MAVGQVDILVGLPTLNNAATVVDVARAIHVCFTRDLPRLRTVMINSDAGSTDGTPELIRDASFLEGDMVQTSHSLQDAAPRRDAVSRVAGQEHRAAGAVCGR